MKKHKKTVLLILLAVIAFGMIGLSVAGAGEEFDVAKLNALRWNYATFAVTVTLVKIIAIIIGYLVAKLGFTTMMAGVKGNDSVELSALGTKFKFKGVTPGLALGLVGILMIGWAISTKHQFSASVEKIIEFSQGPGEVKEIGKETTGGEGKEHSKEIPPKFSTTQTK